MNFSPRNGPMFYSFGYDEDFTRIESHRAISQLDVERTLEYEEEIVRVIVLVPVKRAFQLGNHDVVVIVGRDRARRKSIRERRELFDQIGGSFHDVSQQG